MKFLNRLHWFSNKRLYWAIGLLLPFALFLNLGAIPNNLHTDESRRALVAWEMIVSGNYLVPTIHGVNYFNKPPLYNWAIAISMQLFGPTNLAVRIPTIASVLLFIWVVYKESRKRIGTQNSVIAALAVLVSGRILFYDSFLGLMDIGFAALVFGSISLLYKGLVEKQNSALYLSYTLMALAYLMKGLPAIVFQGLSLIAIILISKDWKRLFSPHHIGAGLLGIGILVSYYTAYFNANDIPLEKLFGKLLSESTSRLPTQFTLEQKLNHWLLFPTELIYHFLPFTLFGLVLFQKGARKYLFTENKYAGYLILAYLVNIPVYWISIQVYPRYLFPFLPLLYIPTIGFITRNSSVSIFTNWIIVLFKGVLSLLPIVLIVACFVPAVHKYSYAIPLLVSFSLISLVFIIPIWKASFNHFALAMVALLLMVRIVFNLLILPERIAVLNDRNKSKEAVLPYLKGKQVRFLHPKMNTDEFLFDHLHNSTTMLFSVAQNAIIPMDSVITDTSAVYLVSDQFAIPNGWRKVTTFKDELFTFTLIEKTKKPSTSVLGFSPDYLAATFQTIEPLLSSV